MSSLTVFAGSVPGNYETYLGPLFFEPYALDLVERITEAGNIKSVLEIACGTGRVTKHLAEKFSEETSITATDLNKDMLSIAQQMVASKNVQWQVADAHQLPFEENALDLVVCQYGVMFFQDKLKAFREVNRVLRKGGSFLFNTWDKLQYNALSQLAQTVLEEIYPEDPPKFLEKGPFSFFDNDQIKEVLKLADFKNVSIEKVSKIGMVTSAHDAINGIIDGTPNYGYIIERNTPISQVKQKLEELLIEQYGEENLQLPMQAFVIHAIKI